MCTLAINSLFVTFALLVLAFVNQKTLAQQARVRHSLRLVIEQFVDMSGICLVCVQECHSRLQVLAHCSEKRCHAKTQRRLCCDVLLSGVIRAVSAEVLEEARQLDKALRQKATRSGHTHAIVQRCAKRKLELQVQGSGSAAPNTWIARTCLKRKTSMTEHIGRAKRPVAFKSLAFLWQLYCRLWNGIRR